MRQYLEPMRHVWNRDAENPIVPAQARFPYSATKCAPGIKAARKAPIQIVAEATTAEAKIESRIDRYKQQLYDSREEVLLWKTSHDEAVQRLAQAQDLIRVLQARLAAAEGEISNMRRASTAKVVEISSKQSK